MKNTNAIRLYTLDEAREIIERQEKKKRKILLYFLKQKAMGLLLILLAIFTPILLNGDATASLIFLPLGTYLLFTKNEILY